ncbi:MAG: gliding motility-associated C-terminal domain-containing protein [Saprospiraceae bacterium]|nr:gliding motility-associated C-terminal domain-containing protein [Saprospiraceae bacterium]
MRPIRTHLLLAGLLLLANTVFGQALNTFFAPATVNASVGGTVSLQLKVTNFTNITSVQFPITYNSAVLQFASINNATLPSFSAANYNATTGKVTISWYPDLGLYPNGYTAADNSALFTINFNVIANGTTAVNVASTSPGIEVTRSNNVIAVNFASGGTNVTAGSGGPGPLTGFHVIANTINIPQGQTACMPVTVHDFDNVVLASYVMHWDVNVLQYQSTQNYNLPDMTASSFNPFGTGNLIMSWYDQNLVGVTRADGTAIYEVCFKAVGQPGTRSMITFDSNGFPVGGGPAEVVNTTNQNVWKADSGVSDTIFVVTAPPPPNAVTFTADKDTVAQGQVACVEVKVKNFTDVISMQLGMTYDATKVQFKEFQFGTNPLSLSNANFNPNIPGEIKFTWFDPNAVGVDLPDNTTIYSVCFTATGAPGSQSPFNFTSLTGFAVEIVKEPGGEVIPALNNGHIHITAFSPPILTLSPTMVSCPGGTNGAIAATVSNAPTPTFNWAGPSGFPGSTQQNLTNLQPGTYTVTVTGQGGLTTTATTTISAPSVMSVTPTATAISCPGGSNGSIALAVTGGTTPYNFTWTGTSNPPPGSGATGITINNLAAGSYAVTITDANNCTLTKSNIGVGAPTAITLPNAQVTITDVTCFGLSNGTITVGNATGGNGAPFTYAWAGPGGPYTTKSISNLAAGIYSVTIPDKNGCTQAISPSYTITGPSAPINVSLTAGSIVDATCFGANNGKAAVTVNGGTPNYIIAWKLNSPTGQTLGNGSSVNSLPPGNFYPVITDSKGCTATLASPVVIGGPTSPIDIGTPTIQHVKCAAAGDGCITIAPAGGNGGITLQWTGGLSTPQICNLNGGDYYVTLTDSKACTQSFGPITVNQPQPINLQAADTTITPQNGLQLGGIQIDQVVGGVSPFTFNWSGPSINAGNQSSQSLSNIQSGNYSLTITDANNCTKVFAINVPNTNILVLATAVADSACNSDACLHITIPAGAIGPFIATWTPGGDSKVSTDLQFDICNLSGGTVYSVTLADASGNTYTMPPQLIYQKAQALAGSSLSHPFDDFKNGSIELSAIPANADLSYKWNTGDLTNKVTDLDSGTYVVTITNLASGCTSVNTYKLKRTYQPFSVSAPKITQPSCLNTPNGSICFMVQGGDGPNYIFQWTGPNGATVVTPTPCIYDILPGIWVLTIIDESGNVRPSDPVDLKPLSNLDITNVNELSNYNNFQVSSVAACDGIAQVVYAGNVGPVSVAWSNGITTANNSTLCGGQYGVTVTDNLGCSAVWNDSLSVPAAVVVTAEVPADFNGSDVPCHGSCTGIAKVFVVGGIAPYTVTWPSGQTDQILASSGFSQANQLCAGEYKVTVVDKNGQTNSLTTVVTVTVTEPEPLVLQFEDITIPSALTACDGQVLASIPDIYGDAVFTWSSNLGQNGEDDLATGLCAGDLLNFVVETENGCTSTGEHQVPYPVDQCLNVRPVITPGQQDGNNDYTLIACIEQYPNNSFEVYNRWGQLVFETEGYNNLDHRWEGFTRNGDILPDGVYFYVLKYVDADGLDQIRKGYVNLLR